MAYILSAQKGEDMVDPGDGSHVDHPQDGSHTPLGALVIGAIGVVYGDIGTSPLYALREALRPVAGDGLARAEVLGVLSLLIWSLILIVTVKYVLFLLRADHQGEGGVLALYTLSRLALGRRSIPMLALAVLGAALFFGDAAITPAISVLSAVEGLELLAPSLHHMVLPVACLILTALFAVQRFGTASISALFGPLTALWFLTMGALGLVQVIAAPEVLSAIKPGWALGFLADHPGVAFIVLGAVFLAVTGAEALYADLGHFGRRPIRLAWFWLVFPALVLNYLGQGALVLADATALESPFFRLAPDGFLAPLVILATLATVIAAQAVISGAFSMARAASQLGLLPRLVVRHTSATQSGQIYLPLINWTLLAAVLGFALAFQTSTALAAAYGIAVTGAMLVDTVLAIVFLRIGRRWPVGLIAALALPFLVIEGTFFASNALKLFDGGIAPVLGAAVLALSMAAWWRGTQRLAAREVSRRIDLDGFARSMARSSIARVSGTAVFLTADPIHVPGALLHNIKHNQVLHAQNVILTIVIERRPRVALENRVDYVPIDDSFARLTLRFGFLETPNVSRALGLARERFREQGFRFNVMTTSFFLGRRKLVSLARPGVALVLDRMYLLLAHVSADPADVYHLPRDRVVELGAQMSL